MYYGTVYICLFCSNLLNFFFFIYFEFLRRVSMMAWCVGDDD